jgi:hypothetical protein
METEVETLPVAAREAGTRAGMPFLHSSRTSPAGFLRRRHCTVDLGRGIGQSLATELANLNAWYGRVASRPSAAGSLHPLASTIGSVG